MANLKFELEREGNVAIFMDRINENPRDYANMGLELVKKLDTDPRFTAHQYIFYHKDTTIFIYDAPRRRRVWLDISSINPKESKSQLLNIVNNGQSGVKR